MNEQRECPVCSEPFAPYRTTGRPQLYCSKRCREVAKYIKRTGRRPQSRLGMSVYERLMSRVVKDVTGCWLWQGYTDARGYGRIRVDGESPPVHRVAYELIAGEIPSGLDLDHLCCVPNCVNPDHLEPVTRAENTRRGGHIKGERSRACVNGHPRTEENTVRYRQRRYCRACQRAKGRRLAVEVEGA